jgi:hypothetical protein
VWSRELARLQLETAAFRVRYRPALTEPLCGSTKSRSRTLAARRAHGRTGADLRQIDLARRQIGC